MATRPRQYTQEEQTKLAKQFNDKFYIIPVLGLLVHKVGGRKDKLAGKIRTKDEYLEIGHNGEQWLTHRVIYLMTHGKLPDFIDHKDRDHQCNDPENLRECTLTQNQANRGVNKRSKTGYKGVKELKNGKFQASIAIGKEKKYLGTYNNVFMAASAYDLAAVKEYGEFACTNEMLYASDFHFCQGMFGDLALEA